MSTSIYYILCRRETRVFLICTLTGTILQLACRRYIKNHPEFFEEPEIIIKVKNPSGETESITNEVVNEITKERRLLRLLKRLRGGFATKLLIKKLIKLAAAKGVELSAYVGLGLVVAITPQKAITRIIENSLPHSHLDLKTYSTVDGIDFGLETCDDSFKYLKELLMDNQLPFEEKRKRIEYAFGRMELDEFKGNLFISCMMSMLILLLGGNPAAYRLVIESLLEYIKTGRISKAVARMIVKRLKRKGQYVDPELLDLLGMSA